MTELQEKLSRLSPEKRRLLALRLSKQGNANANGAAEPLGAIAVDPENRRRPFPLTDLQQAYWIGRGAGFDIDVASHCYLELEGDGVELQRMKEAWRRVVDRHEMLRAVVLPHGEQQVLEAVPPYEIQVSDLRGRDAGVVASKLAGLRDALSHQILDPERWPLFEIQACQLDGGKMRIFLSLDALFLDGWSLFVVLQRMVAVLQRAGLVARADHAIVPRLGAGGKRGGEVGGLPARAGILAGTHSEYAGGACAADGLQSVVAHQGAFCTADARGARGTLAAAEGAGGTGGHDADGHSGGGLRRSAFALERQPAVHHQPAELQPPSAASGKQPARR